MSFREFLVLVHRIRSSVKAPSIRRSGLLCLGALREVFVLAFAISAVMFCLWQSTSFLKVHLSADKQPSTGKFPPVLGLGIDREHGTILAHTWGGELCEFSLETAELIHQTASPEVIAIVSSERNSVIANLSEWAEGGSIHHRVDIIQHGELLVSEEFGANADSSATVHASADGSYVLVMTLQGTVIGWDLSESKPKRYEFSIGAINLENSLSSNGRRLFVSSDERKPFFCDARTGGARIPLIGFEGFCCCSEWSSDGSQLAVGNQHGDLMVFDTRTGECLWHQKLGFMFARSLAFSSDGKSLATGGFDHTVRVWNLAEPDQAPVELLGQYGIIRGLVFGPADKTLLSACFEGTIREWSLTSGQTIRQIR